MYKCYVQCKLVPYQQTFLNDADNVSPINRYSLIQRSRVIFFNSWRIGTRIRTRELYWAHHLIWCHCRYGMLQGIYFMFAGSSIFVSKIDLNSWLKFEIIILIGAGRDFWTSSSLYAGQSMAFYPSSLINSLPILFSIGLLGLIFLLHMWFSGWQFRRSHKHR